MSNAPRLTVAQWRAAVEGAAREVGSFVSVSEVAVLDPVGLERTTEMIGAHLPLVGGGGAFDLALVATPEGCQAIARSILGMADSAPIKDGEVTDAIGEIVNMLGGTIKRRIAGHGPELVLGLPLFIRGYVAPSDRLTVTVWPTRFGTIDTMIVITGARG
jgi:hypothetical protein